ncbi:MAG TPA: bestrophin family ion channel [Saprospiraceae bacterium]|nr:bestrophin family ion channel [Saprospiraceae bacterium]
MVIYNPKDWWKLIFTLHKSDTFRMMLPGILGVAMFTGLVAYLENDVIGVTFKNTTAIHALVGFVLSLLLVFRTNTAYDRWWEGRKLWGSFVNNSRNLALKLSALDLTKEEKLLFWNLISNYIYACKEHLRGTLNVENLSINDKYNADYFYEVLHVPNKIMKAIYHEINQLYVDKRISGEQLLFINDELKSFTDNLGACERIKKTPIPYSYSLYLKKIIFIYVFTMPIGFVVEFGYWAMPIVAMIFYVFGSIELLAEEIEDPFGLDPNDLPTDQITETIKENVAEILL